MTAAVGVAGTVAQLDELAGELTRQAVERELERLAGADRAERARRRRDSTPRAPR